MSKKTIVVDGINIHYQIHGNVSDDKPKLLFGHSYLWNSEMWNEQIEFFKDRFVCIVPDLIAHGESGVFADKQYTIERLAEINWQFMQALGVKKFSIIGLSVGGMWGTRIALDYPEAVQALVLMDTFVGAEWEEKQPIYFKLLDEVEQDGFTEEMLSYITTFFLTKTNIDNNASFVERLKKPLRENYIDQERRSHLTELGRCIFSRKSMLENLSKLSMPVQFLVGSEDAPRPVFESNMMAEQCKNAEVSIINNAAHISNIEQPFFVNKVLDAFFTKALKTESVVV